MDLEKIKARAKEGLHYSKWLNVWELISEVERLNQEVNHVWEIHNNFLNGPYFQRGEELHSLRAELNKELEK